MGVVVCREVWSASFVVDPVLAMYPAHHPAGRPGPSAAPSPARTGSQRSSAHALWSAYDPAGPQAGSLAVCEARAFAAEDAVRRFADATGIAADRVQVWKRYIEVFTRAQLWWAQRAAETDPANACALGPPAAWTPDAALPRWRFVNRRHPSANPVWVCGAGHEAPPGQLHER